MKVELKVLIAKLNPVCRKAFEHAAQLCVSHTNYEVDVEHLFWAIMDLQETDIHVVLRHLEVEESELEAELTKSIDGFKRGNTRTPVFSPNIPRLLELAWSVSSLHFRSDQIRSVSLLMAALSDPALRGTLQESAPSLLRIPRESLEENANELVRYSPESGGPGAPPPEDAEYARGRAGGTLATEDPMDDDTGKQALAEFLRGVGRVAGGQDPEAVAEEIWPAFKAAVSGARAEVKAKQQEGLQGWQEARHPPPEN